jgi:multidrug efflux system membrane fusion protein
MQTLQQCLSRKNNTIALGLVVAMCLWIGSGLWVKSMRADSREAAAESPSAARVVAHYSESQVFAQPLKVRARSEANRKVLVRAQIGGLVVAVPVVEGAHVAAGEIICQLATEDRQLLFEEAVTAQKKAQMDYTGAQRLKSAGYQSRTAIAAAKSALDSAKAVQHRRALDLDNLKLKAPFSGIVDTRQVEVGDLMERGDACATLLELNPLIISGQVSETDVGRLRLGSKAEVRLLNGQTVEGILRFIGHDSDLTTRTFRIEVAVPNPNALLRSGITADVLLYAGAGTAHRLSPALLLLDDAGSLGLRILDSDHRVVFQAVEIVGGDTAGVWVRGLPAKALVISVGQHYVSEGEQVVTTIVEQSSVHQFDNTGVAL